MASEVKVEIRVNKRQLQNDKEYLKYVRIQMWWNFVARLLLGFYELVLAFMVIYAAELHHISFLHFSFNCSLDRHNNYSIIEPLK